MNVTRRRVCPPDLKLIGFDVDGVFTDGRFYLSDDGVETKAFNTQDGFGIRQLLEAGITVAVISGRRSAAVEKRMQELNVSILAQGCINKVVEFDKIATEIKVDMRQCAFVGDDVPDLPLLRHVGFSVAVANAVPAVIEQCDLTTVASGGAGAVREVCDHVLQAIDDDRG